MLPDDEICYCYHVSMRKLVNFARRERPVHASRMTECLGAGTGCGWCIPFLKKIASDPEHFSVDELTPEQYAERRETYRKTQPRNEFDEQGSEAARQAGKKELPGTQSAETSNHGSTEIPKHGNAETG